MFIRVLNFIIFTKLLIISQCEPKLGPVQFDPLTLDISNPMVERPPPVPIAAIGLRSDSPEEEPGRPCHGYDFDENNCKLINNRVLCGYNKNTGDIKNKENIVDMGNGCRMRGDRIECGYVTGPFEGIRRPPPLANGGDDAKQNPSRTSLEKMPLIKKLRAASVTTTSTEKIKLITTKSSLLTNSSNDINMTFNLTDTANSTLTSTATEETLNISDSTTTERNSSSLPTATLTLSNNITTDVINGNDSNAINIIDNTSEISSINTTKQVEAVYEYTSTKSDTTKSESPLTTKKSIFKDKIKIKRRKTSQDKIGQPVTLCVEKQDRIVCYDDHFLVNKSKTI